MTDASDLDLLARRRAETTEQIHRAALDLFETQGVRETTVLQIAQRAGVSPRTFFRYFSAKEDAALPAQHRLHAALDATVFAGRAPRAILTAVADASEAFIRAQTDPGLVEHKRIAQLLAREPELQAYAGARDRELAAHLMARIAAEAPELDGIVAQLLAELATTMWRVTWDRWGAAALEETETDPAVVYREVRAAIAAVMG